MTDSAPAAPPAPAAGPVATAPAAPSAAPLPPPDRHDPHRPDDGHVPRRPGPDDRRGGDAHHRRRPRGPGAPGLGHDGLPHHRDHRHAALRQARRHLRAQEALHHRDLDLHRRLGAVYLRDVDGDPRALPRGAGPRRRWPVLAGAGDHRRHRAAPRAREVPGLLPRRLRHRLGARPGHRRLLRRPGDHPRHRRLALGLPRQRADRHRRPRRRVEDAAPAPPPPRPPHRLGRRGPVVGRPRAAPPRRRAGPRVGLDVRRRPSPATSSARSARSASSGRSGG